MSDEFKKEMLRYLFFNVLKLFVIYMNGCNGFLFTITPVIKINRFANLRKNMSLLDSNDLKETQKLDKKLTRQKILLGAFL